MKSNILRFLLYFLVTAILYYETVESGLVMDYWGWLERFEDKSWTDALTCFGYNGMQQVGIGFLFVVYKLIGNSEILWSLVYWFFHAFNAVLLFQLLLRLFNSFDIEESRFKASLLSLIWLCCCFQGEVVIWKVCQNYFLSVFFGLICLIRVWDYLSTERSRYLYESIVAFGLGILVFEQSLITFGAVGLLYLLYFYVSDKKISLKPLVSFMAPFTLILFAYFLAAKLWMGDFVGHYGSEIHYNTDLLLITGNYARYLLKYMIYWRMYSYSIAVEINSWLGSYGWAILLLMFGGIAFWYFKRPTKRKMLTVAFLVLTLAYWLPVCNLFLFYEGYSAGDRYGYFSSLFFYPFLFLLLEKYSKQTFLYLALGVIMINVYYVSTVNKIWVENQYVLSRIMDAYKWEDDEMVFILNSPESFQRTYLFLTSEHTGLRDALIYYGDKELKGEVHDVMQYHMTTRNDGATAKVVAENKIQVSFNQWGTWWTNQGIGAPKTIENEFYKLEIFDWYGYDLYIKEKARGATFIYQDGPELKELKL